MAEPSREEIIEVVLEFVNAQRWSVTQALLENRTRELWAPGADRIFEDLLEQHAADDGAVAQIRRRWDILKAARDDGLEAAFERAQGIGTRRIISNEVMQLVRDALASGQQEQLDDVLDLHPDMIPVLKHIQKSAEEGRDPFGGGA